MDSVFFQGHPNISLCCGDATAHVRMNAGSEGNLEHYCNLLKKKKSLDEKDFIQHPERIYNMDKTGVPLDPNPPKLLVRKTHSFHQGTNLR